MRRNAMRGGVLALIQNGARPPRRPRERMQDVNPLQARVEGSSVAIDNLRVRTSAEADHRRRSERGRLSYLVFFADSGALGSHPIAAWIPHYTCSKNGDHSCSGAGVSPCVAANGPCWFYWRAVCYFFGPPLLGLSIARSSEGR